MSGKMIRNPGKGVAADERTKLLDDPSSSSTTCMLEKGLVAADNTTTMNIATKQDEKNNDSLMLILIYGLINTIMTVPCMYGYAAVIFNNDAFQPDINALSKLVLFSSIVHQICFAIFSSLPFSIGQVQDAGLIFLSAMANRIANTLMQDDSITREEIVSTTIVILGVATSSLGLVLVVMGKFRLADLVSYLPMPVVGGYLGYIGYFCVMAGVSLCIDKAMIVPADWAYLLNMDLLTLAIPGLLAGLGFCLVSRYSTSDTTLPIFMVSLPLLFYVLIYITGYGVDPARDHGWLGPLSQPVSPQKVFELVKLDQVHWFVLKDCFAIWAGMVFVVSFSSCLDVAAISMDMGEALDVNNELMTVGVSNCVSGLMCGFTGSYIFSQTIFTYRTGVKSRAIGIFVAAAELILFLVTFDVLEVTPLFFLGGTLIFIGYDLLYEWLVEVRHKLLLSEYGILMSTFISIFLFGINGGIVVGILMAGLDYVVKTAQAVSLTQVERRSSAVWNPEEWRFLQQQCYNPSNPKIMTFDIKGSVFFGSSLQLLNQMLYLIGIKRTTEDSVKQDMSAQNPFRSPRHASLTPSSSIKAQATKVQQKSKARAVTKEGGGCVVEQRAKTPEFVVIHLGQMTNLDASAAQGCFLQLAKMCGKRGVVVCASAASVHVDWTLRAHKVAYSFDEEEAQKEKLLGSMSRTAALDMTKIILFETVYEALEFSETCLLERASCATQTGPSMKRTGSSELIAPLLSQYTLSAVFKQYLGLEEREIQLLEKFEVNERKFHEELELNSGDAIFEEDEHTDSFYVIMAGSVALHRNRFANTHRPAGKSQKRSSSQHDSYNRDGVYSGAGFVSLTKRHSFKQKARNLGPINQYLQAGSIIGFVDFILDQNRRFGAVAKSKAIVAKISREGLDKLKAENPELQRIVDKVLLQASIRELANILEP